MDVHRGTNALAVGLSFEGVGVDVAVEGFHSFAMGLNEKAFAVGRSLEGVMVAMMIGRAFVNQSKIRIAVNTRPAFGGKTTWWTGLV